MYRWGVVLPTMLLMLMLAYVDRVNISFAMAQMEMSLGITSTVSGMISGIFFIGYTLLQAPGGHWAAKYSVRKCI